MGTEDKEIREFSKLFSGDAIEDEARRNYLIEQIEKHSTSLPTNMSITTAIDDLFQCFSVGGKIKEYYRYGTLSNCKEQREKLWFAIKSGNFTDKSEKNLTELNEKELEKRQEIQNFYKERLIKLKSEGSSEDIWDIRNKKLVNPFKE